MRRTYTGDVSKKSKDRTNYRKVAAITDSAIRKAVDSDPDTFLPDERWFKAAQIVMPKSKEIITLRLDPDILAWFRQGGRGYQTRINAVLRAFISGQTAL